MSYAVEKSAKHVVAHFLAVCSRWSFVCCVKGRLPTNDAKTSEEKETKIFMAGNGQKYTLARYTGRYSIDFLFAR